jgi:hypothetical protein
MTKKTKEPETKVKEKPKLEKKLTPNELLKQVNIHPTLLTGVISHLGIREEFYEQPDKRLMSLEEFQKGINDYKKQKIKL